MPTDNKSKKIYKKAGRTILIKSTGSNIDEDLVNSLENVINKSETKYRTNI
jgi:hypothetical protein